MLGPVLDPGVSLGGGEAVGFEVDREPLGHLPIEGVELQQPSAFGVECQFAGQG